MELGMIGLGHMGTNMVRRMWQAGHQCGAYDLYLEAVDTLAKQGAVELNSVEEYAFALSYQFSDHNEKVRVDKGESA
jgi:6-phosphogluconate dehydrogenase